MYLCRDCDLEYMMTSMECSGCRRMRYRVGVVVGNLGEYLWGDQCSCDPRPPSVWEVRQASLTATTATEFDEEMSCPS